MLLREGLLGYPGERGSHSEAATLSKNSKPGKQSLDVWSVKMARPISTQAKERKKAGKCTIK